MLGGLSHAATLIVATDHQGPAYGEYPFLVQVRRKQLMGMKFTTPYFKKLSLPQVLSITRESLLRTYALLPPSGAA
jgi:hypothetical protein